MPKFAKNLWNAIVRKKRGRPPKSTLTIRNVFAKHKAKQEKAQARADKQREKKQKEEDKRNESQRKLHGYAYPKTRVAIKLLGHDPGPKAKPRRPSVPKSEREAAKNVYGPNPSQPKEEPIIRDIGRPVEIHPVKQSGEINPWLDDALSQHSPKRRASKPANKKRKVIEGINMSIKDLPPNLIEAVRKVLDEASPLTDVKSGDETNGSNGEFKKRRPNTARIVNGAGVTEATGVHFKATDPHNCATHVYHEEFGKGKTLYSEHAEPDSDGNIEWYKVMFDHGIEKCMTENLQILQSESHERHKKMKKEEVELDEARRFTLTPAKDKKGRAGFINPLTGDFIKTKAEIAQAKRDIAAAQQERAKKKTAKKTTPEPAKPAPKAKEAEKPAAQETGWKVSQGRAGETRAVMARLHDIKDQDIKQKVVKWLQADAKNELPNLKGKDLHNWAVDKFKPKKGISLAGSR